MIGIIDKNVNIYLDLHVQLQIIRHDVKRNKSNQVDNMKFTDFYHI